jgi:hypothetical protein
MAKDYKKLSTLIKDGASKSPKVEGKLFEDAVTGVRGSCSIGAAALSLNPGIVDRIVVKGEDNMVAYKLIEKAVGYNLMEKEVISPVTHQKLPLQVALISLNDYAEWSREAIADWLEGLGL